MLPWALGLGTALALLAALGGCAPPPKSPLRVASSPWPGYEPLYYARDQRYLDANRVVPLELPSSSISFEAFRNGSADAATMTLNQFMELLHGGVHARIVAILDYSNGADAAMAVPAVAGLAQVRGRRIAVGNFAIAGAMLLTRMLEAAHLERHDVQVLTVPEDVHEQNYVEHGADVYITFEPFKSHLAALGAHAIYDSSRMPREIVDVLAVRDDVFTARRDDVCHLVHQWFRVLDELRARPDDAFARMGQRMGKSPAEFRTMMGGLELPTLEDNRRMLLGPQAAIRPAMDAVNAAMRRFEQWQAPVDAAATLGPGVSACLS